MRRPGLKFVVLAPNEKMQELARALTTHLPAPNFGIEFNSGYAVSHLSRCALAVVASGTAANAVCLAALTAHDSGSAAPSERGTKQNWTPARSKHPPKPYGVRTSANRFP